MQVKAFLLLVLLLANCQGYDEGFINEISNCGCCQWTETQIESCKANFSTDNDYKNLNFTSSLTRRLIRSSSDPLSAAIDKMQKLARLITGISIQNGLISGSINPADFAMEILRLGVKPADFGALKPDEIQNQMDVISGLKTPGKPYQKLIAMKEMIRGVVIISEIEKWKGKDEFLREMKAVQSGKLDLEALLAVKSSTDNWKTQLAQIQNYQLIPTDKNSVITLKDLISSFKKASGDLKKALSELKVITDKKMVWKYPSISSAKDALISFIDIIDKGKQMLASSPTLLQGNTDLSAFASSQQSTDLISASKTADSLMPSLQLLIKVITTRLSAPDLASYPGFPMGQEDITEISISLADQWIRRLARLDLMTAGLKQLTDIGDALKDADEALETRDIDLEAVNRYIDHVTQIQKVPKDQKGMERLLEKYLTCSNAFKTSPASDFRAVEAVINLADTLDTAVGNIGRRAQELLNLLNTRATLDLLAKVEAIALVSDNPVILSKVIDALKTSQDVITLKQIMSQVGDVNEVPNTAGKILAALQGSFQPFIDSFSEFQKLKTCLDQHGGVVVMAGGPDPVVKLGEDEIRKITTSKAISTIGGITSRLKIKSNGPEAEALKEIDAQDVLEFGEATRAITTLKEVLDAKNLAQDLINKAADVITRAQGLQLPELTNLKELKTDLTKMYSEMGTWKLKIRDSESVILSDYSEVFTLAQGIPGSMYDLRKLSDSMDVVIAVAQDSDKPWMLKVKDGLDRLGKIGLDFASFKDSLSNVGAQLANLDLFFTGFNSTFAQATMPPMGQGTTGTTLMLNATIPTTKSEKSGVGRLLWILAWMICFAVFGALIIIILILCWKRRKTSQRRMIKKRKDQEEAEEERLLPQPPTTPPAPTDEELEAMAHLPKWHPEKLKHANALFEKEQRDNDEMLRRLDQRNVEQEEKRKEEEWYEKHEVLPIDHTQKSERILDFPISQELRRAFEKDLIRRVKMMHKIMGYKKTEFSMTRALKQLCRHVIKTADMETTRDGSWAYQMYNHFLTEHVRTLVPLEPSTQIVLRNFPPNNSFMHANLVTFPNNIQMILTQSPQNAKEHLQTGDDIKVNNFDAFWWMVKESEVDFIVMMCDFIETNGIRWASGEKEQCAEYFPRSDQEVKELETVTLKCTGKEFLEPDIVIREIQVHYHGQKPFSVKHIQYTGWSSTSVPETPDELLKIYPMVNKSRKPILVHCPDGCERSGAFAYIEHCHQTLCQTGALSFSEPLIKIRQQRSGIIDKPITLAFCIMAVHKYTCGDARGIQKLQYSFLLYRKTTQAGHHHDISDQEQIAEEEEERVEMEEREKKMMEEWKVEKKEAEDMMKMDEKEIDEKFGTLERFKAYRKKKDEEKAVEEEKRKVEEKEQQERILARFRKKYGHDFDNGKEFDRDALVALEDDLKYEKGFEFLRKRYYG